MGHRVAGALNSQSNNRGVGWKYVHICIDDASRIAYTKVMKN